MAPTPRIIDLHSHSTCSDGQYPVEQVAERAAGRGVKVWALSDHDTVAGLAEAASAAARRGMAFVPGIELSAFLDRREIHLLGHFVDPGDAELGRLAGVLGDKRRERMGEMLRRLAGLGVGVSLAEVERFSGGKNLGRPHLARALVEKGVVADVREAFDRYLGDGRPAWADRYRLPCDEAIALVRRAGGVATVAHPGVNKLERGDLARLRAMGLRGVEASHSDHNPSVRDKYARLCGELDLVPTAGSDFHGEAVAPGRELGSVSMTEEAFAALQAARG